MRNHVARNFFDCGITISTTSLVIGHGLHLGMNEKAIPQEPYPEYEHITLNKATIKNIYDMTYLEGDQYIHQLVKARLSLKYGDDSINAKEYFWVPYFNQGKSTRHRTTPSVLDNSWTSIDGLLVLTYDQLVDKFGIKKAKDVTKEMREEINSQVQHQIDYIAARHYNDHVELVVTAIGDANCQYTAKRFGICHPINNEALNAGVLALINTVVSQIDKQNNTIRIKFDSSIIHGHKYSGDAKARIRRHIADQIESEFGFRFPLGMGIINLSGKELTIAIMVQAIPSDDAIIFHAADDGISEITDKRQGRTSRHDCRVSNLEVMFSYIDGVELIDHDINNNGFE